ncbi:MAG TPA: YIP1 family protein [Vicinamibacterales bacterium]
MADTFVHRLMGAAMLDTTTYEEIEADRSATPQALAVVVLSSAAAAIGARDLGTAAAWSFFATAGALALMTWAAFALLTFEIGARILPTSDTRTSVGELLRTLGFAAAPGLIQVCGVFPGLRWPTFAIAICWAFAASVIAVRQALDYTSTRRALAVCGLGLTLAFVIAAVLGMMFSTPLSGFAV